MSDDARYRLAPVRDDRARAERATRGELADAIGDASTVAAKIADADRRIAEARARLDAAVAMVVAARGSAEASSLALADRFVARLRDVHARVVGERARMLEAQRASSVVVTAAQTRLAEARARKEQVERHFASWRAGRRKLAERRED